METNNQQLKTTQNIQINDCNKLSKKKIIYYVEHISLLCIT